MMDKFGWAFIGSGRIANIVAKEINNSERHQIVTVYSRNSETAARFSKQYGAQVCNDLKEAINNKSVDAVYVATPQNVHYKYVKEIVESSKKAIIVEKPFVVNYAEYSAIQRMTQEKQIFVNEAMCMLLNPIMQELLELKEQVGRIKSINIQYAMGTSKLVNMPRLFDAECAGGALLEIGVYGLTLGRAFMGIPINVQCKNVKYFDKVDVAENIVLEYENHGICQIYNSLTDFKGLPKAVIIAESGKIVIPFFSAPWYAYGKIGRRWFIKKKKRVRYIYEFDYFADMIKGKLTEQTADAHLKITGDVVKIMDECRKQMNVVYPNDMEEIR